MDVTGLRSLLSEIRPGAHISQLFGALQQLVPLDACVVQSFRASPPHHIVFASYQLPTSVADAWLLDGEAHFSLTLAPLMQSPPGEVLNDIEDTPQMVRDMVPVYGAMEQAGLHQRSALVLSPRTVAGFVEHRFLALLSRRRSRMPAILSRALSSVYTDISQAAEKIILPSATMGSAFIQYLDNRRIGYACMDETGAVMMSNTRAHELAVHYSSWSSATSFSALERLVAAARSHYEKIGSSYMRYNPSQHSMLVVSVHALQRAAHDLADDSFLVTLEEVEWDPTAYEPPKLRQADLTQRKREIANHLFSGNLTAKEIGTRLGISTRTVQKHTEDIYRTFNVTSREGLRQALSESGSNV